jgi:glycerophosphoryl diester phosphodiesterase
MLPQTIAVAVNVLVAAFLFLGGFPASAAPTRAERIRAKLDSADRTYVFVVMHRGDWRHAPENSVDAIRGSIEKGADVIELDVAKTKDGEYVLVHDSVIDRISNGKGRVDSLTLAELKKFRLKSSDGKTLTDHRILTLKEAFDLTRGKILVNIDKFGRDPAGIAAFVRKHGMEREVILKGGFSPQRLRRKVGASWPQFADGTFFFMPILSVDHPSAVPQFTAWQRQRKRPGAYELCFKKEKPDDVLVSLRKLQSAGGPRIWVNTLWDSLCAGHTDERGYNGDPDGSWGWCLERGATMIQTDRPVELIRYLEKKNRRCL